MGPQEAHQIWVRASERVKDKVIAPTLYRALELGVGLTLEDDYFVVGFANADLPMAGHIRSSQHLPIVEQSLSEVLGRKVRLRIVEGTTIQAYEEWKNVQAVAEAKRSVLSDRREMERQIEAAWDEVAEKITRGYARLHLRQLAQTKGNYIVQAFEIINQAVNELNYSDDSDEIHKRSLARVFEKLATVVEVPSSILAYEFFKLRREGRLN
ncbi:MAG: hypothetical protein N3B12_02600 [Armatimonadetes bacterium]|nr:hypothetical protein [Armatimonadota bacterium]